MAVLLVVATMLSGYSPVIQMQEFAGEASCLAARDVVIKMGVEAKLKISAVCLRK